MNPSPPPETTLEKPKRPAYLGWLAGYLFIYGSVLFVLQYSAYKMIKESGVSLDYSPLLLMISIVFLGLLGMTAATGLWWGKNWGWWLSAFYFLYALARSVNNLLNPSSAGLDTTRSWLSAGLGILLGVLVLFYLYSREILVHFHLERFPRWASLLILLVASVILVVVL